MYDIVPGALQHLREADILSKAGLAVAAQGQEFSRTGIVHSTYRQGARLSGIVEVAVAPLKEDAIGIDTAKGIGVAATTHQRFPVTVEINDVDAWHFTCACSPSTSLVSASTRLCVHAAALLYYWLARPFAFTISSSTGASPVAPLLTSGNLAEAQPEGSSGRPESQRMPSTTTVSSLSSLPKRLMLSTISTVPVSYVQLPRTIDSLALLALPDLRAIAKEYEIITNGLNKQELIEAILDAFRQPEIVRKGVGTLEKTQRQFLATFTLAGAYMIDEELRSLFERFGLGKQEQFQSAMAKLQGKGLLLRASYNSAQQVRANLGSPNSLNPLEVTWHVPSEVCAALPITLPVTPFHAEEQLEPPLVYYAEPYRLLADLLLVARALEGQPTQREEKRVERRGITGGLMRAASSTDYPAPSSTSPEGSMAIPAPAGLPPQSLLASLREVVALPPAFLRFAYRILRLGEILYTDAEAAQTTQTTQTANPANGATVTLRMLPNAAELLLGPTRREVTLELFSHWLRQATYAELFELAETPLRLRCRTIAPNQPALRQGELEAEQREARQWFISLLAQAPPRQWISFSAFARFVFRLCPTFLQRRQRLFPTPHWWLEQDEGRPLHPDQWNDWIRAEGRYLAHLLQGPLYWWGASDIALSPGGQLLAFRLTPLAELFLRGSSGASNQVDITGELPSTLRHRDDSTETEAFTMQDGLPAQSSHAESAMYDMSGIELSEQGEVLIVSSAGNWPLIDLVERFTRVNGAQAGRLRYQITPAALSDALRRGADLAPFLELLRCAREATPGDIPVKEMLSRLERRVANYGRVRLYTGVSLLATADTLTLRELAATTSIEQQTIHAIHPTLLILKKQGGEQLIDELKHRGQAPLLHGDG